MVKEKKAVGWRAKFKVGEWIVQFPARYANRKERRKFAMEKRRRGADHSNEQRRKLNTTLRNRNKRKMGLG